MAWRRTAGTDIEELVDEGRCFGIGRQPIIDNNHYKTIRKMMREERKGENGYEIICPYCLNKYGVDKVLFRAITCDPKDPDKAPRVDPKLAEFWKNVANQDIDPQMKILDPCTNEVVGRVYDQNVLVQVTDKYDIPTNKRICPVCHNKLPSTAGKSPIKIISILGSTAVGKSVFIAILADLLLENVALDFNLQVDEVSTGFGEIGDIRKIIQDIKAKGHNATAPAYIPPLTFQVRHNNGLNEGQEFTLCFFDFPGESTMNNEYLNNQARHISNAAGYIFLMDPLQIEGLADIFSKERESIKEIKALPFSQVLDQYNEHFISSEPGGVLKRPTAIVMAKTDYLRNHLNLLDKQTIIFDDYRHNGYVYMDQIKKINAEIKKFLQKYNPGNLPRIDGLFKNYSYFGVSSLGAPQAEDQGILPCRVTEPLLWLLFELGFICGKKR